MKLLILRFDVIIYKILTSVNQSEAQAEGQTQHIDCNQHAVDGLESGFPSEIPDPGSGPSGAAAQKVVHILLYNTSMWKKIVTLTNPCIFKTITGGKEEANMRRKLRFKSCT